ncbi:MAG: hypothetical protein AAF696_20680 [Bacteroidota bacterium]
MKQIILINSLLLIFSLLPAQVEEEEIKKERLDFAKTYFEYGANFFPSFQGANLANGQLQDFRHPASIHQYLNWGGFHFWGKGEFYVSVPLGQYNFGQGENPSFEFRYSVVTGFRIYPWRYKEKKIRPYLGASWSALDFKQIEKATKNQPLLSKDFLLTYDAGLLYGINPFTLRLGLNFFPNREWNYPISRTEFSAIKTPPFSLQIGLMYAMESSGKTSKDKLKKWNNYPRLSSLSSSVPKSENFFLGIGPSISFSLNESDYNQEVLPYLKDQISSSNYFDISLGYHFHQAGIFTALSFRNPTFETEAYESRQEIKKYSLALEVNKFLIDYSGFTPYMGINLAFDQIRYEEKIDMANRSMTFNQFPQTGLTFGWDIRPGKNDEALILRTNLRWYPFSTFSIDDKRFNFNQLEYNLIQVIFYPGKWRRKR